MPWFKVDDTLAFHAKVVTAGNAAMGLWVRAGAWCMQQLTDGHVPNHMISVLGSTGQAKALVAAGLWIKVDDGYRFHEWDERQPSRDQVENDRQWNATRMALHRDHELVSAIKDRDGDRCRYCGIQVSWKDRRGPAGATYDHVIPRGPNTLDNIVVACRSCNSRKGQRTPEEAGMNLLPPGSLSQNTSRSDLDTNQIEPESRSRYFQDPDPTRPDPIVISPSGDITSPPPDRPDIDAICEHLADRIHANGSKRPTITAAWREAARLMLDRDQRTPEQVHAAIDWCQDDEFWRSNILSLPKLREQYDRLRLQATRTTRSTDPAADILRREMDAARAHDHTTSTPALQAAP